MQYRDPLMGYVYCALASNGAVKVGMTCSPKKREQTLRSSLKVAMLDLDDFFCSRPIVYPLVAERHMQSALSKNATHLCGKEWFYGADYEKAKAMVSSIYSTESQFLEAEQRREERKRQWFRKSKAARS